MNEPKVVIVMPAYNAAQTLKGTFEEIPPTFRKNIILVDDQSSDGTAQIVQDVSDPLVRVIIRRDNHGYAKSIRCGLEHATGTKCVIVDSDFNHAPAEMPGMLRMLENYDFVSASRFLKGGKMTPMWRGISSRTFDTFIRLATGSRLTDNLYGFFAFKQRALESCSQDDIFFGFGDYSMRFLFYLQKNKVKIWEVPSVCGPRFKGQGNKKLFRTFCRYFIQTLMLSGKGRII